MPKIFDPNAAATSHSGIFGLPFNEKESALILVPVPWEVTTSYGGGTSRAPAAILKASHQVDLFDLDVQNPYEPGIHMVKEPKQIKNLGVKSKRNHKNKKAVNAASALLNDWVYKTTATHLDLGKTVGIVGGDHSTPFGAMVAYGEKYKNYGVLHFDAHHDLRKAYEGFEHSHASIMRNVCDHIPSVKKLVQVGIRDFCEEESDFAQANKNKIKTYYDRDLKQALYSGKTWATVANEIVGHLPEHVFISFDIDGLDPKLCPHTGTPVPGGLEFDQAVEIIRELIRQKKTIIGFDLNEVAPGKDEWDANVGARMLYKLCALTFASQGKCQSHLTTQA